MSVVWVLAGLLRFMASPEPAATLAALPLLGVWEPTVRARETGTTLEFCADGSLIATTGILLDFEWRRDAEDKIVLVYKERTSGQEVAQPFTVVDASAARKLTHGLAGFVSVENVFDRRYVAQQAGVDTIGAPRLVQVGVRLDSARW